MYYEGVIKVGPIDYEVIVETEQSNELNQWIVLRKNPDYVRINFEPPSAMDRHRYCHLFFLFPTELHWHEFQ